MRLTSFNGLANGAANSHELPKRIKVFSWGVNKTLKGDVVVNEHTAKVFNANQKAMGRDVIALDYEHNTVPNTPEFERTKEPRLVAAHVIPEVIPGDGVYLSVQDWTPSGQECAKNYKDLSPAPYTDDNGVLIGLHSCALTQTGAVFDLTFLNSIGTPVADDLVTLSSAMGIQVPDAYKLALQKRAADFNPKSMKENLDYDEDGKKKSIKVMRKAMAMSDDASDEDVLRCMSEAVESGKWVKKGPLDNAAGTTNQIKSYSAEEMNALIKAQLEPLTANITSIKTAAENAAKAAEETERAALIAQASRDGKVIPLSAETVKTIAVPVLREMIGSLKKVLTMDRSPMAQIKAGEVGKINGSSRGGPVTLNVGGVPVTVTVPGSEPQRQLTGLARATAGFQAQFESATSN